MMRFDRADWTVLLIGGPSSVGKSTAAKHIGRQFGVPWLQVDDLRLALQWSRTSLPNADATRKLYFFDETPDVWRLPPNHLRDAFIGIAEVLSPAIAKVIENHLATKEPIVLEGDGLLPSLLARSDVRKYGAAGQIRAVFVMPATEETMLANMRARGWGPPHLTEDELQANARAKWLYGRWLADEARRHGLPVVASHPRETLVKRIVAASSAII